MDEAGKFSVKTEKGDEIGDYIQGMKNTFGRMVLLVHDYDAATSFYQQHFGCKILFDEQAANGLRYVHLGFHNTDNTGIWLLKADTHQQEMQVGHQITGQPVMVLYTDDIDGLYKKLNDGGVRTKELVKIPAYSFFHCFDLYGNEIVVAQLTG